jgi:hypothetical protein
MQTTSKVSHSPRPTRTARPLMRAVRCDGCSGKCAASETTHEVPVGTLVYDVELPAPGRKGGWFSVAIDGGRFSERHRATEPVELDWSAAIEIRI